MEMKSSFHALNVTNHSSEHMMRETKVTYLIDPVSVKNEYKKFNNDIEDFKLKAQESYWTIKKQKMQKKQFNTLIKETVINIKKDTTVKDIEKVFTNLNSEFGGYTVFEIAIHKDEGYFYNRDESLEYRPNADIFYNENDKSFYLDRQLNNKADISKFEKRYNFHAHVIYSPFDLKTGKGRATKADMEKLQTIVADTLGMQRGERNSKAKRMSHWQLKQQADIKREAKKLALAKLKDVQEQHKQEKAKLIASGKATQSDYIALKKQYDELKAMAKKNELTVMELKNIIVPEEEKKDVSTMSGLVGWIKDKFRSMQKTINELKQNNHDYLQSLKLYAKLVGYSGSDLSKLDEIVEERLTAQAIQNENMTELKKLIKRNKS